MIHYDLHRLSTERHGGGDSLRAALLILATVIAGYALTAVVPDATWVELSVAQEYGFPDWHGNVLRAGPAF